METPPLFQFKIVIEISMFKGQSCIKGDPWQGTFSFHSYHSRHFSVQSGTFMVRSASYSERASGGTGAHVIPVFT
jgi:hypothetical protein